MRLRMPVPATILVLAVSAAAPLSAHAAAPETEVLVNLRHAPGLSAFVRAVSDPSSPRYRHYATVEQLTTRFGATAADRRRAVRYLRAHGLRADAGVGATWVLARGSDAAAARAFAAPTAQAARAGGRLAVPSALRGTVTSAEVLSPAATPTAQAATDADPYNGLSDRVGSPLRNTGTAVGCPEGTAAVSTPGYPGYTPNQIATAYGLDVLHRAGLEGQGMRVALVESGGFHRSDIETFARCFGLAVPRLRTTNVSSGAVLPPVDETALDLEVLMGALPRLGHVDIYQWDRRGISMSAMLRVVDAALGTKGQRPDVISISYAACEPLLISRHGSIGITHALDAVMQLAAGAGISVLASSGDQGFAGCEKEVSGAVPTVSVPASLPHVTAVGGTNFQLSADNRLVREVAWNDAPQGAVAGTGGGKSLLFARPWWQRAPGTDGYDRMVPDVSALAEPTPGYAVFCTAAAGCRPPWAPHGGWQTIAGTSAASPLVASGLVLLDQAARRAHQGPVGFVNPLLYQLASGPNPGFVFNDVTIGNNDVGAAIPADAGGGKPLGIYQAKPGYDQATGLGSIKFAALNQLALRAAGRARVR